MLDTAQHIFIINWTRVQIVEVLNLISVLKMLLAIASLMIADNYEFLTLVLPEFAF